MQNFVDYLLENNVISPFSCLEEEGDLVFTFCPELDIIETFFFDCGEDEIPEVEMGKYNYKINKSIRDIYIYIIKFFNDVDIETYKKNPELYYTLIADGEFGITIKKSTQVYKKTYNLDALLKLKDTNSCKIILEIPSMSYILK